MYSESDLQSGSEYVVYLGKALQYIFNNGKINIYQGNVDINLLNYMPLLKTGLSFKQTINVILQCYLIVNDMIDITDYTRIIMDDIFNEAFNGDIPALFHNLIASDITISEAINLGLSSNSLNTVQTLTQLYPYFNPNDEYQYTGDNDDMIKINTIKISDIEIDQNKNLSDELQFALSIINILLQIMYNEPQYNFNHLSLYDFLNVAIKDNDANFINCLISDPWIHLLYAIIIQDSNQVKEILKIIDFRINNNEAYRLAIKVNNPEIINIIRDYIVNIRLIEQEALDKSFVEIVGPTDISRTLFRSIY